MANKRAAEVAAAGGPVRRFFRDWPAHITTVALMAVLVGLIAYTGSDPSRRFGVLAHVATFVHKACLAMIGACLGYWVNRFFFYCDVNDGDVHDRWRAVVFMAVGMYVMGSAA